MTIKELDDKLNSPGFQDPENGDLFYNFFTEVSHPLVGAF